MRGGRYPEADTSWHRVARVQGFQLAAEQMGSETEAARVLVEHGHQVIRDHVLVGIFSTERTKFSYLVHIFVYDKRIVTQIFLFESLSYLS